jgi:hypothetical protein
VDCQRAESDGEAMKAAATFEDLHPSGILRQARETERKEIRIRALAAVAEIESRLRPLAESGDAAAIAELNATMKFEIEILKFAERRSSWKS